MDGTGGPWAVLATNIHKLSFERVRSLQLLPSRVFRELIIVKHLGVTLGISSRWGAGLYHCFHMDTFKSIGIVDLSKLWLSAWDTILGVESPDPAGSKFEIKCSSSSTSLIWLSRLQSPYRKTQVLQERLNTFYVSLRFVDLFLQVAERDLLESSHSFLKLRPI